MNLDATTAAAPVDDLRRTVRGAVLTEADTGYHAARAVWNAMIDRRPFAIVQCVETEDVVEAVRFARRHALAISVKSGGHNVAGHAVGDGALMIDLSMMRAVRVDPETRRARVQGGATWRDVDEATQAHGLATPGGLISDTGVAGLTLSGGIGWLRSRYGLCIDNLVSAEVVVADGRLLSASADENPDLYWALRGGGGNFGAVVTFEFALHPVGPTLAFCAPIYPISAGPGPIRFWRDFLADKHDRIGSLVEFSTIAASDDYPRAFWGQRCYTIAAVYAGDAGEGEAVMRPLREQGNLVTDFSARMDYCDLQRLFDELVPAGAFRAYWKSHLLGVLPDEMIDGALANAADAQSDKTLSSLWNLGGAVAAVADDATAFGDRSIGWMYSIDSVWANATDDEANIVFTRRAWAETRRFAKEGRLYLNFAGHGEDNAELVRSAFGKNYLHLAEIKAKYDPENLFRFNHNIAPDEAPQGGMPR